VNDGTISRSGVHKRLSETSGKRHVAADPNTSHHRYHSLLFMSPTLTTEKESDAIKKPLKRPLEQSNGQFGPGTNQGRSIFVTKEQMPPKNEITVSRIVFYLELTWKNHRSPESHAP
jgi:hypothetical protein